MEKFQSYTKVETHITNPQIAIIQFQDDQLMVNLKIYTLLINKNSQVSSLLNSLQILTPHPQPWDVPFQLRINVNKMKRLCLSIISSSILFSSTFCSMSYEINRFSPLPR